MPGKIQNLFTWLLIIFPFLLQMNLTISKKKMVMWIKFNIFLREDGRKNYLPSLLSFIFLEIDVLLSLFSSFLVSNASWSRWNLCPSRAFLFFIIQVSSCADIDYTYLLCACVIYLWKKQKKNVTDQEAMADTIVVLWSISFFSYEPY